MALYKLGEISPTVAMSAYVAPSASVIGKVVLAERSSVWFGATLRGDNETIIIYGELPDILSIKSSSSTDLQCWVKEGENGEK